MSIRVIALDLEGTLISNAHSQIPRPVLYRFLDTCHALVGRVVMCTTVSELRKLAFATMMDHFGLLLAASIVRPRIDRTRVLKLVLVINGRDFETPWQPIYNKAIKGTPQAPQTSLMFGLPHAFTPHSRQVYFQRLPVVVPGTSLPT